MERSLVTGAPGRLESIRQNLSSFRTELHRHEAIVLGDEFYATPKFVAMLGERMDEKIMALKHEQHGFLAEISERTKLGVEYGEAYGLEKHGLQPRPLIEDSSRDLKQVLHDYTAGMVSDTDDADDTVQYV